MKLTKDDALLQSLKLMDLKHGEKISSSQIDKGMTIVAEPEVDDDIKRRISLIL